MNMGSRWPGHVLLFARVSHHPISSVKSLYVHHMLFMLSRRRRRGTVNAVIRPGQLKVASSAATVVDAVIRKVIARPRELRAIDVVKLVIMQGGVLSRPLNSDVVTRMAARWRHQPVLLLSRLNNYQLSETYMQQQLHAIEEVDDLVPVGSSRFLDEEYVTYELKSSEEGEEWYEVLEIDGSVKV